MSPDTPADLVSYHLSAPARIESVELVHQLIEQLWTHEPPPEMIDRIRFETAVIEILGNIVEHAARLDPPDVAPRQFEVTVECSLTALEARFGDDGKPAEIDLGDVTMPDLDAESGRGLALALASVDDISYERTGPVNRWRLVCRRQS